VFHEATSPVLTGENSIQNGTNDWSLFHRTSELVNCFIVTGKSDPFDNCWFHKTFSYPLAVV
jgi:hypothetical protein